MSIRKYKQGLVKAVFRRFDREEGFYEQGQVESLASGVSDSNTNARPFPRDGIPINPSDSATEGSQRIFLCGQGYEVGLPTDAGESGWVV